MKLRYIYNLLGDNEFLEIRKNKVRYVLADIYNYLNGYPDFNGNNEEIQIVESFESLEVDGGLLLDCEVQSIYYYNVFDCSELLVETMTLITVE